MTVTTKRLEGEEVQGVDIEAFLLPLVMGHGWRFCSSTSSFRHCDAGVFDVILLGLVDSSILAD